MFDTLKTSDKIWSLLQHHWKTYTRKYHVVGVEERHTQEDNSHNDNCGDDVSDNDDNCIVSLSGESDSNGKKNIESGSDDNGYCCSKKVAVCKTGEILEIICYNDIISYDSVKHGTLILQIYDTINNSKIIMTWIRSMNK